MDYFSDIEASSSSQDEHYAEADGSRDYHAYNSEHHERHRHEIQRSGDTQSIFDTIKNNFEYSLKYNIIKLLVPLGKIIVSVVILAVATPCVDSKVNWVIAMLVYDVLYFSLIVATIRLVLMVNQTLSNNARVQERRAAQQNQVHPANAQNNGLAGQNIVEGQQGYQLENQIDTLGLAKEATGKHKLIESRSDSLEIVYFAIFVSGQLLLYLEVQPVCQSVAVDNLMITFIAMGWAWILSLILIPSLAFCFPVLVYGVFLLGRDIRGPVPIKMTLIDSLKAKKFSTDLPGNHECTICIIKYNQGDDLIQLKCSPLHHFHESCIKQWLRLNSQCPMCRKKIEDMSNQ